MSLTCKHFIELAEIFKSLEPDNNRKGFPGNVPICLWLNLRKRIAEFCAKHNDNFDYDRFMKASENDDPPFK